MQGEPWLVTVPLWDLQHTHRLKDLLIAIVQSSLLQLTLYLLLGILASLSFSPSKSMAGLG